MNKKIIKWKTDLDKSVIIENLHERYGIECNEGFFLIKDE